MRVLVTGGAGFIGSHLADRLLAAGHEVRAYDCLDPQVHPNGPPDYLDPQVELLVGDVRDEESLGKYRAGDIRHCIGDPTRAAELLDFRAAMEVGTGLGQLAEWLAGQEADDRVEQAMEELRQRGLER